MKNGKKNEKNILNFLVSRRYIEDKLRDLYNSEKLFNLLKNRKKPPKDNNKT